MPPADGWAGREITFKFTMYANFPPISHVAFKPD